jgi:predicted 3-demethylubiquinone-9 3-methyltransferase (glyoxalase superfamily)
MPIRQAQGKQKISPMLWFDGQAEEAVKFYVSVFKNSKMGKILRYDAASSKASGQPEGSVLTVAFQIEGMDFTALNGGPQFKFNEAVSLVIACEDQAEIDYYWEKLSAVPEAEVCGWLKDKYGVSWQVAPKDWGDLVDNPAGMKAMMKMKKLIIADIKAAK